MDDVPVGGGLPKANAAFDEQPPEVQQIDNSGAIEDRLVSKNWQTRAQAFEELILLFKGAQNEKDQIFKDHTSMWKKYLTDPNPGALEKCLDCLQTFIDLGDPKVVLTGQNDIIKQLIEKCVGHAKASIKLKGLECFNLLFEVTENFEESVETMLECLGQKNIKVGEAAQRTLNSWLSNYGAKKVNLKPFMKVVETNANSTNPAIRNEAMNFYKECYKWLGEGLLALISDLKKQQLDDLKIAFQEIKESPKPKTIRHTRTEKKKIKEQELEGIIKQDEESSLADSAAYELAEAVDLLSKYGGEWQDMVLELKKWNEKKDHLEKFIQESNVPKLNSQGDYSGLVKTLKKLCCDPHQVVSQLAIKACGNLAKGLRQDFGEQNCKELLSTLIGKFKEKKTLIDNEVHQVLDAFCNCTNLEAMASDIAAAVEDKAPTVKNNICLYIERIAQVTYIDVLQRCGAEIIQALLKTADDKMGDVRDSALSALGIFKGRLGESYMSKYLLDIEPKKLAKVNESAATVKPSKYDKPEAVVAPPPKPGKNNNNDKKGNAVGKKKGVLESKEEEKKDIKKASNKGSSNDVVMDAYDEQPVGGSKDQANPPSSSFDDMPIGGNKNRMAYDDDMPISGKGASAFDEKPLGGGGGGGGYNLDDIEAQEAMLMNSMKPKKVIPPKVVKAAASNEEEKKGWNDDVEMEDQSITSPKVVRKPPPKAIAKAGAPKATATSSSTAGAGGKAAPATGVQVPEEDLGQGLSKEEAEQKIQEVFPQELWEKFDSAKWQDKQEGFKGFGEQIVELQPSQDIIEALAKFIKMKMKDWKENNINLIKETIQLFSTVLKNSEKINKRSVACLMPFLSEKIGDVKTVQTVHELIILLSEAIGPKFVGLQIIKHASTAKAPKILQESNNALTQLTEDFGILQMPMKEMIGYGNVGINHANPQVRTSAMALFAVMFKHAGEMIRNFLKDIKESTMKLLEEEFAKVTPYKKGEFKSVRTVKGQEEIQAIAGPGGKNKAGGGGGGLDDMMPREDISKQMTPKLIALFKSEDWKDRKKAADEVERIIRAANMRIQPVGLNEMMDNVKQKMADPNRAVLKAFIQLETLLVEALGSGSKQFIKKLLPTVLQCFADKQSLVRGDVNKCADVWAENIGAELVMNHLAPLLVQDNPELRTEGLNWILKNKDAIKNTEIKEFVKPLIACLQDKVPLLRQMTEQIVAEVMPITGYGAFQLVMKDLKPAVQNAIKPILEKIKNQVGAGQSGSDPNNGSLGTQQQRPQTAVPALNKTGGTEEQAIAQSQDTKNQSLKGPTQNKVKTMGSSNNLMMSTIGGGSNTNTNKDLGGSIPKSSFAEAALKKSVIGSKQRSESIGKGGATLKSSGLGDSIRGFQDQQQHQQEQLTIQSGLKDRREEHDRKTKWQIEEVKGDQIEKLKAHTAQALGGSLSAKLFSVDFKLHAECIDMFSQGVEGQPEQMTEILDIIFKWAQVKLGESSNTQFALKIFDFLAVLFRSLEELQYQLHDFESLVIIPLLCDKAGINNAILKDKVKKLIRMLPPICDKQKLYNGLIAYGLNSKNMKAQAECLEEMEEFIKLFGVNYTQDKDLKLVAKMADSKDSGVRENSLKVLGEIYKHIDSDIWRIIGEIPPKVQSLIDQRLKKVKGGMSSSMSSSNLVFENQISNNEKIGSPRQKIGGGIPGLKKMATQNSNTLMEQSKKAITPRNALNSSSKPPSSSKQELQQQNQNSLNKSNNPFNQSNKSNGEENKKQIPQPQQQQQQLTQSTFSTQANKQLQKFRSVDQGGDMSNQLGKNMIPRTQRVDSSNTDFQTLNKMSGMGIQNSQNNSKNMMQQQMQSKSGGQQQRFISHDDDDNEDVENILHFINDEPQVDTELDKQSEEIMKHIYQLKHGDLSKRVDSLVSLNEMISQIENNKNALVRTSNDLINAFTHVLMDIFERSVEEIPLRFAKYFITIVLKACSCKEIMREASEDRIFELAEQLLTRLLIEGLDKVGENKEGELILKNLNSSMLRLLENCNHTYIFCVLFDLLRKYKDFHKMPKLPGLIIKCLLKLSKILEKLIDKLDMEKILLAIHEYLVVINHDNKTANDEMGIRIVKTVTNELVKLKRESIWDSYRVIECHSQQDNHIYRWIQIIIKSLQGSGQPGVSLSMSSTGGFQGPNGGAHQGHIEQEIRQIIEELRNSEQFEMAVPKLYNFLENNPQVELNDYLQEVSKTFQDFIKKNLDKYRQMMKEENRKSEEGMMNSMKSTNISDNPRSNQDLDQLKSGSQSTSNRVSQYQSKLTSIKQRFNPKTGENTGNNREQVTSQQEEAYTNEKIMPSNQPVLQTSNSSQVQNLNTSFSDMNNRLTQKWQNVNKKASVSKDQSHMSNTMGGFGGVGSSSGLEKASFVMNQSSGGQNENEQQQNIQGASNSDLNKRLAEMKAKLQALKKTNK